MKCVYGFLSLCLLVVVAGSDVETTVERRDASSLIASAMTSLRGVTRIAAEAVFHENEARRKLSLVHPSSTTDSGDDSTSSGSSSSSGTSASGNNSKSTTVDTKPTGSIASRTSNVPKKSSSIPDFPASAPTTSSSGTSSTSSGGSQSTSSSGSTSSTSTSTTSSNAKSSSSPTDSTSSSSSSSTSLIGSPSKSANSTSTVTPEPTDPGEPNSYKRAFPTVYSYTGDDDGYKSHGYDAQNRPALNPEVDDISQFLDDDFYKKNGTSRLFPKEREEPEIWPIICLGIFVTTAAVLCSATAYKSYRKRREYQQIPASLHV